jgi:hypothetical protein
MLPYRASGEKQTTRAATEVGGGYTRYRVPVVHLLRDGRSIAQADTSWVLSRIDALSTKWGKPG